MKDGVRDMVFLSELTQSFICRAQAWPRKTSTGDPAGSDPTDPSTHCARQCNCGGLPGQEEQEEGVPRAAGKDACVSVHGEMGASVPHRDVHRHRESCAEGRSQWRFVHRGR